MNDKLGITIAVDVTSQSAVVAPEGRLTLHNVQGLIAVARRAGSIARGPDFVVDLHKLTAAEPGAVEEIRAAGWQGSHLVGIRAARRELAA